MSAVVLCPEWNSDLSNTAWISRTFLASDYFFPAELWLIWLVDPLPWSFPRTLKTYFFPYIIYNLKGQMFYLFLLALLVFHYFSYTSEFLFIFTDLPWVRGLSVLLVVVSNLCLPQETISQSCAWVERFSTSLSGKYFSSAADPFFVWDFLYFAKFTNQN